MPNTWTIRSNEYDGRYLELQITEVVNNGSNSSTLNWTFASKDRAGHYYTVDRTTISINNTTVYYKDVTRGQTHEFPAAIGSVSGSITVPHDSNGRKRNVPIVFKTSVWYWNGDPTDWANERGMSTINLTDIALYTLTLSSDAHSSITVNRTASGAGATGILTNGAKLYYNDKLLITFEPSGDYDIDTHSVNGNAFPSGNTYTVEGNVNIVCTSQARLTTAVATDAFLDGVSTIIINRPDNSYYYRLYFQLNGQFYFITRSGGTALDINHVPPYQESVIAYRTYAGVFEQAMAQDTSLTITLVCITYSDSAGTSIVGMNSSQFRVLVDPSTSKPVVSGTIVDVNQSTVNVTNDSSILVRYKSTAKCTISAQGKYGATIVSRKINGEDAVLLGNEYSVSFANAESGDYIFSATDSRGNSTTTTQTATIIPYITPTINASLSRSAPTATDLILSISGNYFYGSFGSGGDTNQLTIYYQVYDKADPSTVIRSGYLGHTINANNTYKQDSAHLDGGGITFQHNHAYRVIITVSDLLSTVTKSVEISKGLPVFDWGDDDFNINGSLNVNGPITVNGTSIMAMIYSTAFNYFMPVGTVYYNVDSTLPSAIGTLGNWTSISTGISGVYGWKRVS